MTELKSTMMSDGIKIEKTDETVVVGGGGGGEERTGGGGITGNGGGDASQASSLTSCSSSSTRHHLLLRRHQIKEEDDEDEVGTTLRSVSGAGVVVGESVGGGGGGGGGGGEVVVVGGAGATTLYSREDGATVLEAADGTTTVLRPQHVQGTSAHRLTLTVEGGDGTVSGEGVTAIVDNRAGTATLVEGAEVVRTVAVSYATPILHHVFLQAAPATTTMHHHPHTTLLQTTHMPASVARRQSGQPTPTLHTSSTTPIILHPPRTAVKEESARMVGGCGNTTSSTTTTSSGSGTNPSCLGDGTATVMSSSSSSAASSVTTSPISSSYSPAPSPPLSSSPSSGLGLSSSSPSSSSSCNSKADDELTSLSWLQDSNLLRGTALSPVKSSQGLNDLNSAEVVKAESPTSDYGDESSDALEPGELTLNDQPHTQPSRSQPIPYNPQVHIKAKPPYSFSCLIFMAIEDSNNKALPVKDIYAWILEHFPYFRKAPTGWKNSVRHNLSLNKCFRKVEKAPNLGKGSLWMVDPAYRPNLLQALSKTPFHPYSNLDRIYMVSTKSAFFNRQLDFNSQNQGAVQRAAAASPETVSVSTSTSKPAGANVPDPELFPYLSRRLGSSSGSADALGTVALSTLASGVHSEDVDAAAAMLALKHGPRILTPANVSYSQLRDGKDTSVLFEENTSRKRKRKRKHTEIGDARMMVISSSPSEDHSYTSVDGEDDDDSPVPHCLAPPPPPPPIQAAPNTSVASHYHPSPSKKAHHSPTSSVDEAFSDDSYDSDVNSEASQADMRQLVEGADALLNLAAVATSLASKNKIEGDSISNRHHRPNLLNQKTQMKTASFRPQKLHFLKSPSKLSSTKVAHDKGKNKSEILTNNNTIINNNNKILKVRRFGGVHLQGVAKHLPASR